MCSEFNSKYTIKNQIGQGTFSDVLKCQNKSTGQHLAVKKLKKQFSHFKEAESLPELLVLQKLPTHPNVLSLLEHIFDVQEGKLFMIFELMEMSLYDLIKTRKRCLPETRVKHFIYQILKGLEHLHSNGIFHRDVKPENILIKKTVVKLADMGSVRGVQSSQPYTDYISTRWYRAPECILTSGCYGPKMDVWACGCVYYELLTSRPIFPGIDEIDQLIKIHHVTGTPSSRVMMKMVHNKSRLGDVKFTMYPSVNFAMILPFTSDSGKEILKRMLAYDPDVRTNVRRLLEHRYFNDLRETEFMLNSYKVARQWSNPVVVGLTSTVKKPQPKPKGIVTYEHKKEVQLTTKSLVPKLTTNSWAPTSNTSKVILAQSKSKSNNKVLLSPLKKRPGQSPVKQSIKKPAPVKPEVKQAPKQQKMKVNSLGSLPAICGKQDYVKQTKSHVGNSNFKSVTKGFLPPIPEH